MEQTERDDELDAWVDNLSPERTTLIVDRALRKLRFPSIPPEDAPQDFDLFLDAFAEEVNMAFIDDLLRSMQDKGLLMPVDVNEKGEICWGLTETGKELGKLLDSGV